MLYNYILGMPLWSLTREHKDDLVKKRDDKREELEALRRRSPESLWEEDLNVFMAKLDEEEQAQRAEDFSGRHKGSKGGTSKVIYISFGLVITDPYMIVFTF